MGSQQSTTWNGNDTGKEIIDDMAARFLSDEIDPNDVSLSDTGAPRSLRYNPIIATKYYPPLLQNVSPPYSPESYQVDQHNMWDPGVADEHVHGEVNGIADSSLGQDTLPIEFHSFPSFPPEIRCKIWNLAARTHPRLLEVVTRYLLGWHHGDFRIERHRIHPILTVNLESRNEAQKVFELRKFSNVNRVARDNPHSGILPETPIFPLTWFRPGIDMIYFGEDSCMKAMVKFFHHRERSDIERVAFIIDRDVLKCCNYDTFNGQQEDHVAIGKGQGIAGRGVNVMQLLHGKPRAQAGNALVPGARNVKEVFFVVKSEHMNYKASKIDLTLGSKEDTINFTFRPAVHDGLTSSSRKLKRNLSDAVQRVKSGAGVDGTGNVNMWAVNWPNFNFVSLAPPVRESPGGSLKHDAMIVTQENFDHIVYDKEFMVELGLNTGLEIAPNGSKCFLQKCPGKCPVSSFREICFYNGTGEAIEKVKDAIKDQIARVSNVPESPSEQGDLYI